MSTCMPQKIKDVTMYRCLNRKLRYSSINCSWNIKWIPNLAHHSHAGAKMPYLHVPLQKWSRPLINCSLLIDVWMHRGMYHSRSDKPNRCIINKKPLNNIQYNYCCTCKSLSLSHKTTLGIPCAKLQTMRHIERWIRVHIHHVFDFLYEYSRLISP